MAKKIVKSKNGPEIVAEDPKKKLDFFASACHQLKEPLSATKLSLEMLLSGDFGTISEEQKEIIEKILQRNKILISLVKDFLDVVKFGEKESSDNLSPFDIENVIESVVSMEEEIIQKKKIIFKLEKPKIKLPKIVSDEKKIYLAVQNIINNAIKYTPVGGEVKVSFEVDKNNLLIKIQDFGIGIPEDQKKDLFTKFFRGTNAKEIENSGSGLGLFISKNIIESNKGKISFVSDENKGTTFTVTLPIH